MALDVRYARSGDASIAYHVVGDAPIDLVLVPDFFSNLVYDWESRHWRPFYDRLAESLRLILFDKRGTGLSDRGGLFPTLETRMEDLRAVLDAVGSERAVVFGPHEGSTMACLYAATYPERTIALALFQPAAYREPSEAYDRELRVLRDGWGTLPFADTLLAEVSPTLSADAEDREWFANAMRVGATPAAGYALNRMWADTDLRDILPAIHVPTLVLSRGELAADGAKDVAHRIRNARLIRIPGEDYWGTFLSPEIPDELERFVATLEEAPEPETVLATVLFTDLVSSTERAAEAGDDAWAELVARHHAVIRGELRRFRGSEVDTAGDGFFATFDGPARAIRCAHAIHEAVEPLGLAVRAGVHTGECRLVGEKPAGIAVNIGARAAAAAEAGEVVVTSTVRDLVAGSGIQFEERGEHELKGVSTRG
ncbi:MAG: adenylate/guanylate cyclase domain-containing protein [Actinobacteria bacterium]|nr:MAG: adenylate/guanylate cyclase domain-containing protein [Actinomycetota bacterium]